MTKYQVTFSYTVELELDDEEYDDRDAEDKAFEEFENLLREYPSTAYFVSQVEEVEE